MSGQEKNWRDSPQDKIYSFVVKKRSLSVDRDVEGIEQLCAMLGFVPSLQSLIIGVQTIESSAPPSSVDPLSALWVAGPTRDN